MAFFYGGYNYNSYNPQSGYSDNSFFGKIKTPVDNGPAWFVAVAPIISLFIEEMIMNKTASIVLWIFTYFLSVCVCKYDKDKILARYYDNSKLSIWYILPIVYLFIRNSVTRQKSGMVVIGLCTLVVALVSNGFVRYASMTEDDFIVSLQSYPCSSVTNFEEYSDISDETILSAIQSYVGHDSILWTCITYDDISNITATCDFDNNGKTSTLEIVFRLKYDGFNFGGIEIVSLTVDGKALSEENEKTMLMQIFSTKENKGIVNVIEDNLIVA